MNLIEHLIYDVCYAVLCLCLSLVWETGWQIREEEGNSQRNNRDYNTQSTSGYQRRIHWEVDIWIRDWSFHPQSCQTIWSGISWWLELFEINGKWKKTFLSYMFMFLHAKGEFLKIRTLFQVRIFESHCGSLTQYGMKHMRAFANICNKGISKDEMEEACITASRSYDSGSWWPSNRGYSVWWW